MIVQFITPSENRLHEKSFSRNAEQVALFDLALAGWMQGCTYVFDIGAYGCSTVCTYRHTTDTGIRIYRFGCLLFSTGVLTYTYIRMYGRSTFTVLSNVL